MVRFSVSPQSLTFAITYLLGDDTRDSLASYNDWKPYSLSVGSDPSVIYVADAWNYNSIYAVATGIGEFIRSR